MVEVLTSTPFFGVIISLVAFEIGKLVFKKTKMALFNPLLIGTIIVILFLHFFKISVNNYMQGGNFIVFFLAPATVVLAIPLFGSIVAIVSVVVLGKLMGIDEQLLLSFMPKSITTPIGIELSTLLGGIPSITVFAIVITGITGNVSAPYILSIFRVKHPVAKGIGIGISSHAVGTSRAIEMGEIEGAMSALSIVIAGILTIVIAPLVRMFV